MSTELFEKEWSILFEALKNQRGQGARIGSREVSLIAIEYYIADDWRTEVLIAEPPGRVDWDQI